MMKETRQGLKVAGLAGAAMAVAAAIAGCSSTATLGNPSTGALKNYFAIGSDLSTGTGPDRWAVSMDDSSHYFSAFDLTVNGFISGLSPMKGTFTTANGFDDLTAQSGYTLYSVQSGSGNSGSGPVGPAIEIPGETALLVSPPAAEGSPRYPAFAVASSQCSALSGSGAGSGIGSGTGAGVGSGTFQFLELPLVYYSGSVYDTQPEPVYGSVQATSTANADGSVSWNFSSFSTTTWGGVTATQAKESGLCANSPTSFGYIVNLSDQSADIAVSPSGFFAWWQANGTLECNSTGGCPSLGYVGFLVPSSPMDTSQLVAGKYGGAELNVGGVAGSGSELSRPVAFGATAGTGTTIAGGVFPNDDTTQAPDSSISIDLGAQSATTNGFYPSVKVTIPNIAAPLSGVAIAGSPTGKNVVFIAANDGANTLYFFLYQQ